MTSDNHDPICDGFFGAVGGTPLIKIHSLSEHTGCTILGKAEFMNPGGSVKDRPAAFMVQQALRSGALARGGLVVEGTAGNTGIGLALAANAQGCRTLIVIPDNQTREKIELLRTLGAELELVPAVPFADPNNYYHVARRRAEERNGFWANQFENTNNFEAHYRTTGPEIWQAAQGNLDGFICASGTGGTIGGVTRYLKEQKASLVTYLIDCEGSSLYNYVTKGSLDASGNSIMEGIGIRRITENFSQAKLDGAFLGTDQEAVLMAHTLLNNDGIFLGGSAALNCVGAVKLAKLLGPGHTIATILCDGGGRYQSRLYNAEWLTERGFATR